MPLSVKLPALINAQFRNSPLYAVGHVALRRLQDELRKIKSRKVISLSPEGVPQGDVLVSHLIQPFLSKTDQPFFRSHTRYWEALQIVKTFQELGYHVDIINFNNNTFVPQRNYTFYVDNRFNFERLTPLLNKECIKILHGETAHILFHNAAESQRLLELYHRRGTTLRARRWESPNKASEYADYITVFGNEFTLKTYQHSNKPIYLLPISTTVLLPWPENKNIDACRKRFLWFASGGMVHKGLDLVLEAFAKTPEYHLTVCGPVQKEKDFAQAFYKELYETPNIHTYGWIDTESKDFQEIANNCVALVYPSCSEGQSGAVVECLHAGLIPIISYESGVDVHDFGRILKTSAIEEIRNAVQLVSSLPTPELRRMSRAAWEYARANHTRARFEEEYRKVITQIMARPIGTTTC
jgi:glycosyltransferase involved in cell wall biosynthesis